MPQYNSISIEITHEKLITIQMNRNLKVRQKLISNKSELL